MEKHKVRPAIPGSFQQVADGDAVRSQVSKILSSPEFQRSERLRRFLAYVVEEILAGRGGDLKEYAIALAVFDRPNSYDPDVDSIVRVEARKLRFRLDQYYETVGCTDPVRIKISKGSYVPTIEWREVGAHRNEPVLVAVPAVSDGAPVPVEGSHESPLPVPAAKTSAAEPHRAARRFGFWIGGAIMRHIGDAAELLEQPPAPAPAPNALDSKPGSVIVAWVVAGLLAVGLAMLGFVHFREPAPVAPRTLQYTLDAPPKTIVDNFALSPDGRLIAMSAVGERGDRLWVRSLDSLQWQVLAGTDDAAYPFWSPDSRYIGFFTADKLKRIAVGGGPAQTICDASAGLGGTWNQDGVIVFGTVSTQLLRVVATGGVPTKVTESIAGRFPTFLPDGQRFLYAQPGQGVILGSLSLNPGSKLHLLLPSNSNSQYVPPLNLGDPGHVLFVREQTLMAQPVKPDSLEPAGDSFPLVEQLAAPPGGTSYLFSASRNGIIAHIPSSANLRQHALFDRSGKPLAAIGAPVETPGLVAWSPDEKRMIWERGTDLWITELEGNRSQRFTFDASSNVAPQWSPDGAHVAFASSRGGTTQIYQKLSNQAGQDELVVPSGFHQVPSDWTRGYIIVRQGSKDTAYDLLAIPMDGEKKPIPLLQTKFNEIEGVISKDRRWLAYASDESGHFEVYVQPFLPGNSKASGGKWQISLGGGRDPHWRGDGRELFYIAADRKLMAVPVQVSADSFSRGTPKPLFEARIFVGTLSRYAVSANGQRFLMALEPEASTAAPVHVIVNWLAGLKN